MNDLDEITILTELRTAPFSLRLTLFNITIETELEEHGCPSGTMEKLKKLLQHDLDFAYYKLKKISWEMYEYISDCFLADEPDESES